MLDQVFELGEEVVCGLGLFLGLLRENSELPFLEELADDSEFSVGERLISREGSGTRCACEGNGGDQHKELRETRFHLNYNDWQS